MCTKPVKPLQNKKGSAPFQEQNLLTLSVIYIKSNYVSYKMGREGFEPPHFEL